MKHQPYLTMSDLNEYAYMYDPKGPYGDQYVPYKQDNKTRYTFREFVDWMLDIEDND